jgi:peptidoglycan/xylan/chitin deacetylase (PgdA/CDA1 family)
MTNVIMFHNVRQEFPAHGLAGDTVADFQSLIETLTRHGTILEPSSFQIENAARGLPEGPIREALLTFDDALIDHASIVAPILRQYNVRGVFFVNSEQYITHNLLRIHRWHSMRQQISSWSLVASARRFLGGRWDAQSPVRVAAAVRWDESELARTKFVFNYLLKPDEQEEFLDYLEARHDVEYPKFEEVYASEESLRRLIVDGHLVCPHAHSHGNLAILDEEALRLEIELNVDFVRSLGGETSLFAYPFGKAESFNDGTRAQLLKAGVQAAFSSIPASDLPVDRLAIPRLDPKDARRHNRVNAIKD